MASSWLTVETNSSFMRSNAYRWLISRKLGHRCLRPVVRCARPWELPRTPPGRRRHSCDRRHLAHWCLRAPGRRGPCGIRSEHFSPSLRSSCTIECTVRPMRSKAWAPSILAAAGFTKTIRPAQSVPKMPSATELRMDSFCELDSSRRLSCAERAMNWPMDAQTVSTVAIISLSSRCF